MAEKTLDDTISGMIQQETPTGKAVSSLIDVKDTKIDKIGSDIELKTDLKSDQTCFHTQADIVDFTLNMPKADFAKKSILGHLVTLKERKLLSLDRKSRKEIVEIARQPDVLPEQRQAESMVRKLITPRRPPPM